ncbi:MAG: GAF domain-containing protein [Fimbriimonas ginsengisoli]|uniref:histidine kinase n=1 Tax=Fimbriimonas ginsengisoli TaxID=1005039 RepID=A0A931LRA2_FIMGI|nr:GAF domain-containing protein [Fimbriimonas ginsengisoli]
MAAPLYSGDPDFWSLFDASWDLGKQGLEEALGKVLGHCADWFGASGASLFLRHEGSERYLLMAKTGLDARMPEDARVSPGEGIAGASIELGRPLLVSDPTQHPLLSHRRFRERPDLGSAIVLPLISPASGCIGVLNLSRPASAPEFGQAELERAEAVARHIALAVENARLFAKVRQTASEARILRDRLQEVLQCLAVAVVVVDDQELVTEANAEALRMLSDEAEHPELTALLASLRDSLRAALSGQTIRRRYHDEKSDRSWSLVCAPMPGGGATAAIEEVSQHERAVREVARLSRLAEIGQMTAAVAHEIRNPLTGIRSAAQLVMQEPDQAVEFAEIIHTEACKLDELCDQFLDFARPLRVTRVPVDIGSLLKDVAGRLAPEFKKAGVKLNVRGSTDGHTVEGDQNKLEQVVRNLALNALQACHGKGNVTLVAEPHGFTVEDTGEGVPAAELDRLFTPFFTTRPKGTGLGLSNVRKIVDAHGGALSIRSEEGKGSVFEVSLGGRAA